MSAPLRIAYLINSLEGGGAQLPLPDVICALQRTGAQVTLFALARKDGKAEAGLKAMNLDIDVYDGSTSNHFGAFFWLSRALRLAAPDAIITSLTRATLLGQTVGQTLGVPVASWQHSANGKLWNRRLLRWRSGKSLFWIADSQSVSQFISDKLHVNMSKIVTWPLFEADAKAPRAKPWVKGKAIRMGTMGRLHESKGYDVLIDALRIVERSTKDLPPFNVSIAGLGPDEQHLRKLSSKAGLQTLDFLGFVEAPEEYLASLHLYVQPSRREGFCIAMHQAMQAGLPVIATNVGEMPSTLHEQNCGVVVPPEDAEALAAAIQSMLLQASSLATLGESARNRVLKRYPPGSFDRGASEVVQRLVSVNSE